MIDTARGLAKLGDDAGVDFLLTRPRLSHLTQPYYDAWLLLSLDAQQFSHSMGMAGGVLLRQRLPRAALREEGRRLGYTGEALDDFVEIVHRIDIHEWTIAYRRQVDAVVAATKKKPQPA
ncbi:MAG: hypothetical protein U1E23_09590 [Reyranellaceae bacterium]